MSQQQAIFILGMHRSGTSALARVVNLLGAALGDELMAAAEDNQKGFFEHEGAVVAHEALMQTMQRRWCDFLPLPDGWTEAQAAIECAHTLEAIIAREFADAPLWAMKDPRISRLLPLWLPLLAARHVQPLAIVAWRNPLEVAASLAKRDAMPESNALLCWLAYTIESLIYYQERIC